MKSALHSHLRVQTVRRIDDIPHICIVEREPTVGTEEALEEKKNAMENRFLFQNIELRTVHVEEALHKVAKRRSEGGVIGGGRIHRKQL